MAQFASYVRRVLHKTRLFFSRINGPIEPKNGRTRVTTQNDAKFLSKLLDLVCYRLHTCNVVAAAIVTDFINEEMCA